MTKYTPYKVLLGKKANIPGQLQQTPTPVYNYDNIVHNGKNCRNAIKLLEQS